LPGATSTDRKRDAILAEAQRLGFKLVAPLRKENAHALEESRPGNTQAVRSLFSRNRQFGQTMYGYYCAVAHATIYGLVRSLSSDVEQRPGIRPGFASVGLSSGSEDARNTLGVVGLGYLEAALFQVDLCGWRNEEWHKTTMNFLRMRQALGGTAPPTST
jgi:hypothetical protein